VQAKVREGAVTYRTVTFECLFYLSCNNSRIIVRSITFVNQAISNYIKPILE